MSESLGTVAGPALIAFGDGRRTTTDAAAAALLSAALGRAVELCGPDARRPDRRVEWDDEMTFDAPAGAYVRVETGGEVRIGDPVVVLAEPGIPRS